MTGNYRGCLMAVAPSHRVSSGERLNTAETTGPLQQSLRKKGLRLTRQRRVILQVMDNAEQHLDVDQLHLRGDRHYYETHGPRDHIHVACLRCGKVREFESRLYEQLKEQIAKDFQMQVTVSRTEV